MARVIILAAGRALNAISAVIMVRLYTGLLPPEQVGKLSLFLALTALSALALIAPVSSYVTRKAIDWHAAGELRERLKWPLLYSAAAASLAAITTEVFVKAGLLHASLLAGPLVGLTVLGVAISNAGSQMLNFLGRPFTYVSLSCVISWGSLALCGMLCLLVSPTAEIWILGLAVGQFGGGCLAVYFLWRLQHHRVSPPEGIPGNPWSELWIVAAYSAPVLIATCLAWLQTDGYRYVFVHLVGEHALGLFVAGFAVGVSPMAFVDRVIGDVYLPVLTRAMATKSKQHWPRCWEAFASSAILPLVLFGMLACSGTSLFARLLVSPAYVLFAWLGFWGGIVKGLQMMTSLYVGFSYAALQTRHLAAPYFIGAVVVLLCMRIFLMKLDPLLGVAASLACGSFTVLICMARSASRLYSVRFPFAAFARAVLLGIPIVAMNIVSRAAIRHVTSFSALAVLGCDTIYIAAVCWQSYPRPEDLVSLVPPRRNVLVSVVPQCSISLPTDSWKGGSSKRRDEKSRW